MADQRLIVGISGASGVIYGVRLLQALKRLPVETHLVMTRTAEVALAHETDLKVSECGGSRTWHSASTISRQRSRVGVTGRSV